MKVSDDQLQFLARFSKTPDCRILLDIRRARLAEADEKLRTASGDDIYRLQGRAQCLVEEIRDLTETDRKPNRAEHIVRSRFTA